MCFARVKFRTTSAPKASTPLAVVAQSHSTAATSPSFLEARARVKEHVRNINRLLAYNAYRQPFQHSCSRPLPVPAFSQLSSKVEAPKSVRVRRSHLDTPLDHSFIGMSEAKIFTT